MSPDKAALDAATDQAVMWLRSCPVSDLHGAGAAALADALTTQFPGVPGLGRLLVAIAQLLAPAAASGGSLPAVVHMIAHAGAGLVPAEEVPGA